MARRVAFAALISTIALGPAAEAAEPAGGVSLRPHRAVYELKLASRTEKSEIAAVSGRLVYEFIGSACDGYTTQFRFVTQLQNTEGRARISDMRTSSWEKADGSAFDFVNQTFMEQVMTEEAKGSAERTEAGVVSKVTRPVERKVEVPKDAAFPTQHMRKLIEQAKAGERIAQIKLYDGSEGGERVYDTTVVIGRLQEGADDVGVETAAAKPELGAAKRWPMTISYFDPAKKERGEDTPEYQLTFLLYENGISRRLKLDYGDFVLDGRMTDLTLMDAKPCE